MKIIKEINENEMILEFLKAEINSDRWSNVILEIIQKNQSQRALIDNPNLENTKENNLRRKILSDFRGYGKNQLLFRDFPSNVKWTKALINKEELEKVLYINWDYWIRVTHGTRSPKVLVERIKSGDLQNDTETQRCKNVADLLKKGFNLPRIILVAESENSKLVVLEGHIRLTAFLLTPETIPNQFEVIIGFSKDMPSWGNY